MLKKDVTNFIENRKRGAFLIWIAGIYVMVADS